MAATLVNLECREALAFNLEYTEVLVFKILFKVGATPGARDDLVRRRDCRAALGTCSMV